MTSDLRYDVDEAYSAQVSKYFLDITQQLDEIKVKALRNDTRGMYDNLTIINLAIFGLMNEKFELAETSANFRN
jgi:hypothetical protein